MSFQVVSLPLERFLPLFSLSSEALREHNAMRMVVDKHPGFPCRVSLEDAQIGETVLLLNYEHQPEKTPFRASHAIYVREAAKQRHCDVGEIPQLFRLRVISVRAFDAHHMLVAADLAQGVDLERCIEQLFANPVVSYLHLHYAKPGCYAARVERVR
jgi:hypothetical protein